MATQALKILMIGGTGNISLSVSRQLHQQGADLWLLNRSGQHPALPDVQCIRGDHHRPETLVDALSAHHWDAVVNWIAFNPADVARDLQWFRGRTAQYVLISSASCYQNPGPTPMITERTPLENPFWDYSRAKIAAEQFARAHHSDDFPVTLVRPSHTYDTVLPLTIGGWREYTAVARMKQGRPVVVQGDGTSVWTLTHAEDFARGFIGLLGNPLALGEDFHITSDEFLTWNSIYQLTAEAAGTQADIVHVTSDTICALDPSYTGTLLGDKSVSAVFDNSKIKRVVPGFQAQIPFREGIKRTLQWFEEDPRRQFIDPKTDAFIDRLIAICR